VGAQLQLVLIPELYPFWSQAIVAGLAPKPVTISGVQFYAEMLSSDKTASRKPKR